MEFSPTSCAHVFVNLDMGNQLTGVEHASLKRAKLFNNLMGADPIILTVRYRPDLKEIVKELKCDGLCPKNTRVISAYDVFQNLDAIKRFTGIVAEPLFPGIEGRQVSGHNDVKYFDQKNRLVAYKVFHKTRGYLSHINFFFHNKKISREKYHPSGILSSRQTLDEDGERVVCEDFFNGSGRQIFSIFHNVKHLGLKEPAFFFHVDIYGARGCLLNYRQFISMALMKLLENIHSHHVLLFSDKNKYTFLPCIDVREALPERQIRVLSMIHSTHFQREDPAGPLKSHYKPVFESAYKADKVITLTHEQASHINKKFPNQAVIAIPHAISVNEEEHVSHSGVKGRVVYVGRLAPEKQHVQALEIFSRVVARLPWATLHFHGAGSEEYKIREYIARLGITDNVFLHGYCNSVADVYREASCSILTSRMEGFSLALLESIAYGCPVVAYDINYGPSDIIVNNVNGFLLEPGDKEGFSDSIIAILEGDKKRMALSEGAKEVFNKRFSLEKTAQKWRDTISKLIL